MLDIVLERLRQGSRTSGYPQQEVILPGKYRGLPRINRDACRTCGDRKSLYVRICGQVPAWVTSRAYDTA